MAKTERTINEVYELLKLMNENINSNTKDIKDLKTTVKHIESDVLTIKEDVDAIAKTVSEDAMKVVLHERRITRLERAR
jgi:hypothetical protein